MPYEWTNPRTGSTFKGTKERVEEVKRRNEALNRSYYRDSETGVEKRLINIGPGTPKAGSPMAAPQGKQSYPDSQNSGIQKVVPETKTLSKEIHEKAVILTPKVQEKIKEKPIGERYEDVKRYLRPTHQTGTITKTQRGPYHTTYETKVSGPITDPPKEMSDVGKRGAYGALTVPEMILSPFAKIYQSGKEAWKTQTPPMEIPTTINQGTATHAEPGVYEEMTPEEYQKRLKESIIGGTGEIKRDPGHIAEFGGSMIGFGLLGKGLSKASRGVSRLFGKGPTTKVKVVTSFKRTGQTKTKDFGWGLKDTRGKFDVRPNQQYTTHMTPEQIKKVGKPTHVVSIGERITTHGKAKAVTKRVVLEKPGKLLTIKKSPMILKKFKDVFRQTHKDIRKAFVKDVSTGKQTIIKGGVEPHPHGHAGKSVGRLGPKPETLYERAQKTKVTKVYRYQMGTLPTAHPSKDLTTVGRELLIPVKKVKPKKVKIGTRITPKYITTKRITRKVSDMDDSLTPSYRKSYRRDLRVRNKHGIITHHKKKKQTTGISQIQATTTKKRTNSIQDEYELSPMIFPEETTTTHSLAPVGGVSSLSGLDVSTVPKSSMALELQGKFMEPRTSNKAAVSVVMTELKQGQPNIPPQPTITPPIVISPPKVRTMQHQSSIMDLGQSQAQFPMQQERSQQRQPIMEQLISEQVRSPVRGGKSGGSVVSERFFVPPGISKPSLRGKGLEFPSMAGYKGKGFSLKYLLSGKWRETKKDPFRTRKAAMLHGGHTSLKSRKIGGFQLFSKRTESFQNLHPKMKMGDIPKHFSLIGEDMFLEKKHKRGKKKKSGFPWV